jgi:hypothetical protein
MDSFVIVTALKWKHRHAMETEHAWPVVTIYVHVTLNPLTQTPSAPVTMAIFAP